MKYQITYYVDVSPHQRPYWCVEFYDTKQEAIAGWNDIMTRWMPRQMFLAEVLASHPSE